MTDPLNFYVNKVSSIPQLSEEEEKKLWQKIKKGDRRAKRKLMMAYLKLVVPVARRFYGTQGLDPMDLIEEGNIGLMRAIEKYNPRRKVKFSTYAIYWIEQAIRRASEEQRKTIRIPPHVWQKIRKWLKQWEEFSVKYGRSPTVKEISRALKLKLSEVKRVLGALALSRAQTSFDAPIDEDENVSLGDIITSSDDNTTKYVSGYVMNDQLKKALMELEERDREVVILRYGLEGNKPHTLKQIAAKLKVSKERVRQILERADRLLKAAMNRLKYK